MYSHSRRCDKTHGGSEVYNHAKRLPWMRIRDRDTDPVYLALLEKYDETDEDLA